jgi:hypothetical protein
MDTTMKVVFTVVERSPGKSFWTRVGVGFVNADGSMNLRLDAIPVNGTLQVRDWEPYDRRGSDAQNGTHAGQPAQGGHSGPGQPQGSYNPVGDSPRTRRREPARDPAADTFPGDALV